MFKQSLIKPTIQIIENFTPIVIFNPNALIKMKLFIDECSDEIGWLGTATRQHDLIYVHDVLLFPQEVHSTTTEITPEGLSEFGERLLQQANGMEVWNAIQVWGHSHVKMAVNPSGQDNDQMITFQKGGHDWFLRIIGNKDGDLRIDLYDYANAVIYSNLSWDIQITKEEKEIHQQIQLLNEQLETLNQSRIAYHTEPVKADMALKVKKKVYTTTWNRGYGIGGTTPTTNNFTPNQTKKNENTKETEKEEKIFPIGIPDYKMDYIDDDIIYEIGEAVTLAEVYTILRTYNFANYFEHKEVVCLYAYCVEKTMHDYATTTIK